MLRSCSAGVLRWGCIVLLASGISPGEGRASAQAPGPDAVAPTTTIIHCGRLLAVPGEPERMESTIVVREGRIVEVLNGHAAPERFPEPRALIDLADRYVLPGLIDCHVHITMQYTRDVRLRRMEESDADAAVQGVAFAKRALEAGFTTIRDVGSSGDAAFAVRDAINDGLIPGPRLIASGESISPTGGHSDATHGYREDLFAIPGAMQGIADGADECRKAVRAQVKRGADVIKLTATGGVLSNTAAGVEQQFFEDELRAIVETSHQLGRKVAAHAHGVRGINAALRAGVDSIEHGTYLDEESIALFRETGAFYVPTIMAGKHVEQMSKEEGYYPPAVRFKAAAVGPQIQDAFARAYKGGVRIAFGTDCGVGPHGENWREFVYMVEAGMPPAEAIASATVHAAELLGLGAEIGTIEPGKSADIIATARSPVLNIEELSRVVFVMRAGVVHVDGRQRR